MDFLTQFFDIAFKIWNENSPWVSVPVDLLALFTLVKIAQMSFSVVKGTYNVGKGTVKATYTVGKLIVSPFTWMYNKLITPLTITQKDINNRLSTGQLSYDDIMYINKELTKNKGKNLDCDVLHTYLTTLYSLQTLNGKKVKDHQTLTTIEYLEDIFSKIEQHPLNKAYIAMQLRSPAYAENFKVNHLTPKEQDKPTPSKEQDRPTQPTPPIASKSPTPWIEDLKQVITNALKEAKATQPQISSDASAPKDTDILTSGGGGLTRKRLLDYNRNIMAQFPLHDANKSIDAILNFAWQQTNKIT